MPNPATWDDVEARWRPLSEGEQVVATTLLEDVWRRIKRRITDVEDRMGDADYTSDVIEVQANAVMRVLKNPEGKRAEQIDDYSWTRDRALSAGLLYVTDDEWAILGAEFGTGGAFSIDTIPADADSDVRPVSVTGIPAELDWS